MEKKDNGIYHHLRLSRNNPEHMKIHDVLMDLNQDIYKSKNQFIVEALLFYISELENNPLTNSRQRKEKEKEKPITREDLNDTVVALKNDLVQYINKEVLATIISVLGNNLSAGRMIVSESENNQKDNNGETIDERLIELASSWS